MKVKCNKCGETLDTDTNYKLVWCSCGSVGVDGGEHYIRVLGWKENWDYVEEE